MIHAKAAIYKTGGSDDPIITPTDVLLRVTESAGSRVEVMFAAGGRDHYLRLDLADLVALTMRGEPEE